MPGRRTNLALLVLFAAAVISGLAMWAVGSGWGQWPTLVHGVVGVAVVVMAPWKSAVSRRGLRRRGLGAAAPALALSVLVVVAVVSGFAHRAGLRDAGPVLVMQVHVAAAVAALPLWLGHVLSHPVRPRAADLGRRTLLRGALVAGGSAAVTVALPQAGRGVTRSLERGSFRPSAMPVTQWFDDDVPRLAAERWRVNVGGRLWALAELEELGRHEVVCTLDCTGGWYADQRWGGVRLDHLLSASGTPVGRSIEVRSATGYRRRFPWRDASSLVLATRVGGEPLSQGHGFPARLGAPNRRGFWWVKWVDEIRVDDRSWWWQPPFPLT